MIVKISPSQAFGRVKAPPSKSMAHRLLICGALSKQSVISGVAFSKDIEATLGCLKALGAKNVIENDMDNLRIADSLDHIFDLFRRCNKYIDETMPWVLAKEEDKKDRLSTVLYNLIESIRVGAVLLQAYLPDTSENIFKQINTKNISYDTLDKFGYYDSDKVGVPEVLFKRIDIK